MSSTLSSTRTPWRRPWVYVGAVWVGVARFAWRPPAAVCRYMTLGQCLSVALLVVVVAALIAVAMRALWLAAGARRALAGLTRVDLPDAAVRSGMRTGVGELVCVVGERPAAFCAGLLRPRVFLTADTATLCPAELDAVLLHEQAHACRYDPLRRLLARAAADVLFFVPLARWWHHRHAENAELSADRAAIDRLGPGPVAGALLAMGSPAAVPGVAGFDGATQVRVAQLLAEPARRPRPSVLAMVLSLAGLVGAVSLAMCLGQAAVTAMGL